MRAAASATTLIAGVPPQLADWASLQPLQPIVVRTKPLRTNEFVFRFNRNKLPRGFPFYRLVEQCLRSPAVPTQKLYYNVPPRVVEPIIDLLAGRGFPG